MSVKKIVFGFNYQGNCLVVSFHAMHIHECPKDTKIQ